MAGVGAWLDGVSFLVASLLLLLPARTSSSMIDFSIDDFTWSSSEKYLTVENDGAEVEVMVSVYKANTTANPAGLGRPDASSIKVMLQEGKTEKVDLSEISLNEPELCGEYFVCTEVSEKNYSISDYRCTSQIKPCDEEVDLKWSLESTGTMQLKLTLRPNGFVEASGAKLSIENRGNTRLSPRFALNAPEVAAFVSFTSDYRSWNSSNKSLQNAMEDYAAWNMFFWEEFNEYAVRVPGWELLMVDMETNISMSLDPDGSMEVDLKKLKGPSSLPNDRGSLVLIIDPFNRTNDSNRTNNYCFLPLRLKSTDDKQGSQCVVIPEVETEGRNALLLSKHSMFSTGYIYKGGPGRGGIMKANVEEMREKYMEYSFASDRKVRLLNLKMCPSDMDKMGTNNSLFNKIKLAMKTALRDGNKLQLDEPEMKDTHEMVLQMLSFVNNLTDMMVEKDGFVRRIFLKMVALYIKNVYDPSIMKRCLYQTDGCDEFGGCDGMGSYDDMVQDDEPILFPDDDDFPDQFRAMGNSYETEDCINKCGDESQINSCYWKCLNMKPTENSNKKNSMGYDHNEDSSKSYGKKSNSSSPSSNSSAHGGMNDMPVRRDTTSALQMAIKELMEKITQQLKSDTNPERIKELHFLPPSMRQSIKDLFVEFNKEDSKFYMIMAIVEQLVTYLWKNGMHDEEMMTIDTEMNEGLKNNKSKEAVVNLTLEYINITKNVLEEISDIVLQIRSLGPQMLCPMIMMPGPNPTEEMYCLRMAQKDVAEMTVKVKPQEKFFKNPVTAFLKSLKQGWRHPVYWMIENEEVHYGKQNPLTGFYVWDKVAVCSCSRGGRKWSNSMNHGQGYGHTGWSGSGEFDDGFTETFNRDMDGAGGADVEYESGFWYEPNAYGENGGGFENSDGRYGVVKGFEGLNEFGSADRPRQGIDRLRGNSQSRAIYQHHPHMSMVNDGPRLAQSLKLSSITLKSHQREDLEHLRIERGQVVVFNKLRGEHASICDDQDWGVQEAKVVCRALYSNDPNYVLLDETPFSMSHNDSSAPVVMLDKLDCTGVETDLLLCTHRWGKGNCEVKELGGVECKLERRKS